MPYSQSHRAPQHPVDMDPAIVLRNGADAPETASAAEAPLVLKNTRFNSWGENNMPFQEMEIVVHVSALTTAGGETYTIAIEVANDAAFTTPVKVGEVSPTATGDYNISVDAATVERVAGDATHIRANLTAAGAAPSISYYAWIIEEDM